MILNHVWAICNFSVLQVTTVHDGHVATRFHNPRRSTITYSQLSSILLCHESQSLTNVKRTVRSFLHGHALARRVMHHYVTPALLHTRRQRRR